MGNVLCLYAKFIADSSRIQRRFIRNSSLSVIKQPQRKKEATLSNPPISGDVQEVARVASIVRDPNAEVYAVYNRMAQLRAVGNNDGGLHEYLLNRY